MLYVALTYLLLLEAAVRIGLRQAEEERLAQVHVQIRNRLEELIRKAGERDETDMALERRRARRSLPRNNEPKHSLHERHAQGHL